MAAKKDFVIEQGRTFTRVLRWEAPPYVYKPITGITRAAPVRITAASHGIPEGWRVAVVSVKGMTDINAATDPPKEKDYHAATVVDPNSIEFNDVNSSDFKPYSSGGYLQFLTPVSLAGCTARMKIKDKVGGTVLASTEAGDAPLNTLTVALDDTAKTITITMSASDTEDITWKKGVYDLEIDSAGVVTALLTGAIAVTREVTV